MPAPLPLTYQHATALKAAIGLAAVVLLVWWWHTGRQERLPSRLQHTVLAMLGALGFLGWWNFGAFAFGGGYVHHYEFFHYYVGAKYHGELGYTRLYDCVAAAEVERGRRAEVSSRWIRDLETNELRRGSPAVDDPLPCRDRFASDDRWRAFTDDVEWFREQLGAARWRDVQMDHGYNASPVWTVVGAPLANTGPASTTRIAWLWLLDPVLLSGMWALVWWAFGWRVLAVALIFWGTNHVARYTYIGGAFLRQDWMVLAVAAICLARRGWMAASGFALAWSALLRVFPALLVAGLLLKAAAAAWRDRSLTLEPAHARFAGGALLAIAIWLPLSFTVGGSGDGVLSTWTAFVENSRKHLATPVLNNVGLPVVVAFDPANRSERVSDYWFDAPWDVWREGRRQALQNRRAIHVALVGAFLVLLALAVRGQPDWVALTLGIGAIPFLLEMSNYYYGILLGLAVLWPHVHLAGIGLVSIALLSNLVLVFWRADDDRFTVMSLAIVLLVTVVTARFARRPALKELHDNRG
jgi:hypothetical protein